MAARALDRKEIDAFAEVFGDSLDLLRIRITRDHPLSIYAPKTIGNTVHLRSDWGLFAGNGLELSQRGRSVLLHELVHSWQFQNGGIAYIPASLLAQHLAWYQQGSRQGAYRWEEALQADRPWERWNPEQQAQAVQDWWDARTRIADGEARPQDAVLVNRLDPLVSLLRAGRGAPTLSSLVGV